MSFFSHIEAVSPDLIFGLQAAFNADPRPFKVNLSVGVYKDEHLKTPILDCVKKAELELFELEKTKAYLPIDGDSVFIDHAALLVLGEHLFKSLEDVICGAQVAGGTAALRIGAEFLKEEAYSPIFIPRPTWPNHEAVFKRAGMKVEHYPYYDEELHKVNFASLYAFLEKIPAKSVVLLHASCHNPTGSDLTLEEWDKLSDLFLEKSLLPFFDNAYQGFGKGLEEDAKPMRLFAAKGHEMLIASSFSKNFSLYAERIAALFILTKSPTAKHAVATKVKRVIRTLYSNPPLHGAHIISHILGSKELKMLWENELGMMRSRVNSMRREFGESLNAKSKKTDFGFLLDKVGLFSFLGITSSQVKRLTSEYGIYMTADARISVAGLNTFNLNYVVDAIISVTEKP